MIKHIVFDWDGTLADTYPTITAAYNYVFKRMEMSEETLSIEKLKYITGTLQNKDTAGFIFGNRKDEALKFYYEYINNHHTDNLSSIPGAIDVLEFCKDHNIKCYLISNKTNKASGDKKAYLSKEVQKLGLEKYFEKIQGAGEADEDKPSLKATHALFNHSLPNPEEIFFLGDGSADYQIAKSYIKNGKSAKVIIYNPDNIYKGPQPDYMVVNMSSVIEIIKKENNL